MAVFDGTWSSVVGGLKAVWTGFLSILPKSFSTIIILLVGLIVSLVIGLLLYLGIRKFKGSRLFSIMAGAYVFTLFLASSSPVMGGSIVGVYLGKLALWIQNLIIVTVIAIFGLIFGNFVKKMIKETEISGAGFIAESVMGLIILSVIITVLLQFGVAIAIIQNAILIIIAGVVLTMALALGLGYRDEAKRMINELKKRALLKKEPKETARTEPKPPMYKPLAKKK
jgi:uncharacterized protein YacL